MKHWKTTLSIIVLLCAFAISAQDNSEWQMEQRCVGEPTPAADDWSFDGTLILQSSWATHTYQYEWDTPRIIVRDGAWSFPGSGQLSPNGEWYAMIEGTSGRTFCCVTWHTEYIHVYNTVNGETFTVEWSNFFASSHAVNGHGLYWLDNETLLHSMGDASEETWFKINPFTGEISDWDSPINPSYYEVRLAPDSTKALYSFANSYDWIIDRGDASVEMSFWVEAIWHPDSKLFTTYTLQEDEIGRRSPTDLVFIDINGEIIDTIIVSTDDSKTNEIYSWSPDGRYLLFAADTLHLADMDTKTVIDLCIPASGDSSTWSPDSDMLAIMSPGSYERDIQIFDLGTWERHIVGYHSGEIIGWTPAES